MTTLQMKENQKTDNKTLLRMCMIADTLFCNMIYDQHRIKNC